MTHTFLMAALYRAVTLKHMHNVAKVIAQDLDLNVPGPLNESFDKDSAIAECS